MVEAENDGEYLRLKVVLNFEHRLAFDNYMSMSTALVTSLKALKLWGTLDSECLPPGDLLRFEKMY